MFYGLPEFKVAESIKFTETKENIFMVFTKLLKAIKVRRKAKYCKFSNFC